MDERDLHRQEIVRDGGMEACENTDRELYREPDHTGAGDYYSPNIFVTEQGEIGINVGGLVIVKPLRDWHALAAQADGVPMSIPEAIGYQPE